MKKTIRFLAQIIVIIIILTGYWWWQQPKEDIPPVTDAISSAQPLTDDNIRQTISDAEFFSDKIAAGNWIFGNEAARLHLRSFRLTNNIEHLAQAESAAQQYLEHESNATAYTLLSAVAITNHEFHQAKDLAAEALSHAHTPQEQIEALAARFDAEAALGEIPTMTQTINDLQTAAATAEDYAVLTRQAQYIDRVHGDYQQAAELFNKACQLINQSADTWGQAWCLTRLAYYQLLTDTPVPEVVTSLQNITNNLYPNFAPALALQAKITALQGEVGASSQLYQTALENSQNPDLYLDLAEVSLLQNDPQAARQAWESYISAIGAHRLETTTSNNAIVHVRGLVQALANLDNFDQALQEAQNDLATRPQDPGAHHTIATLHAARQQYDHALAASENINPNITLTPDESFIRALALIKQGRRESAQQHLTHACRNPYHINLHTLRIGREAGVTCLSFQ